MSRMSISSMPRAKKSLGQNFLQDQNISRKIVGALAIDADDFVVEIGPGPGALTRFIQEKAPRQLVLFEKDTHYAFERSRSFVKAGVPYRAVLTDAMHIDWARFSFPWKCIGNLPYNVASPLMWDILSTASGLQRAVFMIQKEVGLRLTAQPGSKAYGALSVWVQSFVTPKMEFIVPPHVFVPQPKVDSAVVSFEPLTERLDRESASVLHRLLNMCFQMRRKQLGTIFRAHQIHPEILEELGIATTARPEELSVIRFHELAKYVKMTRKD